MLINTNEQRVIIVTNGKHKLTVRLDSDVIDKLVAIRTKSVTAISSAEVHSVEREKRDLFTSIFGF